MMTLRAADAHRDGLAAAVEVRRQLFGIRGIRSVEIYKKRLKRVEYFPPFLFYLV